MNQIMTEPVATLRNIAAYMKSIEIGGKKVGSLHKTWHDVQVPFADYKKEFLWSGEFVWNCETIHVGRTKEAKGLTEKVNKLLRSAIVRQANK